MDDFMMFKYLKENGMLDHSSIMEKCEKYMDDHQHRMWGNALPAYKDTLSRSQHLDCEMAKHIVSSMYHTEGDRKYVGEKFCMDKAKEVYEKHMHNLPQHISAAEVYVAINAQYHDYVKLLKSWFNDDIECKIIESAIAFWFMDEDYKEGNKVTEYFNIH